VTVFRSLTSTLTLAVLTVLAAAAAGCTDSPTTPSNFANFSQTDVRVGTGGDAVNGRILTVHYTGWFYDDRASDKKGPVFETSTGNEPFSFQLGAGEVITGWDLGAQGMKVGGLRRLVIPPALAYGPTRSGKIPPNATLVFEIELIELEDPAAAQ